MKMMRALDNTIKVMEKMDSSANSLDTKALTRARKSIDSATADMERLRSAAASAVDGGVNPLGNSFKELPGPIGRAKTSIKSFFSSIAGAATAYLSIKALANGFKMFSSASDTYVSSSARLDLINDGLQTQAQLQQKVYEAAQRSRAAYGDMAQSVSKLGMLAGDAFGSNDEIIRFGELMNKAFVVSGADTSEMQAGMHQLTQAMASGRLQGDEYVSIMENAPLLAQAIADSLGVTRGELKELSSDGAITSDVIKKALYDAADDIETKFKSMPITFSQAMTMIKNAGMKAFEPLFVRFSQFINSDAFATLSAHFMTFVNLAVAGLSFLFDFIEYIYLALNIVAEYWPVIAAGLGVLIAVYFPTILSNFTLMIVKLWLMIEPILAQAAAWAVAHWPIILIILAVMGLIAILMNFGVTTEQILGFVGGLFFALGATIWNIIAHVWNTFAMFAEFLINLFIDPTYAVKKLMYDMAKSSIDQMAALAGSFDKAADILGNAFVSGANMAITAINWVIKALNKIPGIDIGTMGKVSARTGNNLSQGLKNFSNSLQAPTSDKNVVNLKRMDLKSLPAAYQSGYSAGTNLKMPNFGGNSIFGANKDIPLNLDNLSSGVPSNLKDGKNPTGGKLDSIGKIDDEINIADEDLKLLKELADIRSIQNFKTLQPNYTFTGDISVREEADIDKIVAKLNDKIISNEKESVEGVYT